MRGVWGQVSLFRADFRCLERLCLGFVFLASKRLLQRQEFIPVEYTNEVKRVLEV